jgi:uncharacterized protein YfdQ (DUF2303 family)
METKSDAQVGLNAGLMIADARFLSGGVPYVIVPEGARYESLEHELASPRRKHGNTTLRDVASFVAAVTDQKTDSTRLYGSYNPPAFKAVFNDNAATSENTAPTSAGWRDHTATYACPLSVEWNTWKGQDGKRMTQEQFAQFIENNLPDIANPPAADMLEISRSLEAKKKVNFASGIRLSNGQNELAYEEQVSGTAAKGKLVVPEEFTIGIPVLEGGAAYAVTARLRYRIQDGGQLSMWFELVRPHKILEDAVKNVWTQIEAGTGMTILNGSPA